MRAAAAAALIVAAAAPWASPAAAYAPPPAEGGAPAGIGGGRLRTAPDPGGPPPDRPSGRGIAGGAPQPGEILVRVLVDGADEGEHPVRPDADGGVVLSPAVADALRICRGPAGGARVPPEWATLDRAAASLDLRTPRGARAPLGVAVEGGDPSLRTSPETWAAWMDYDANLRVDSPDPGPSGGPRTFARGGGAFVAARAAAPGWRLLSSWAWTDAAGGDGLVRLDTAVTWLPRDRRLSVTAGDSIAPGGALGRPWRLGGIAAGTDLSAEPGFSTAPVVRVGGTAQALSTLDVLVDGRVARSAQIGAGSPFAVVVPSGGTASVLLTDAAGRRVEVPVSIPRVTPGLLREGLTLWSAGVGVPRFGHGSGGARDVYAGGPHGFAQARRGVSPRATAQVAAEAGPDMAMASASLVALARDSVALRVSAAASHGAAGTGARAGAGILWQGPWGIGGDLSWEAAFGDFEDVVAASGRRAPRDRGLGQGARPPGSVAPGVPVPRERMGARLSWQPPSSGVSISVGWEHQDRGPEGRFSLLSATANSQFHGIPVWATVVRSEGGGLGTTVLAGATFPLGPARPGTTRAQGFVSGGTGAAGGFEGSAGGSRALGTDPGAWGWRAAATRSGDFAVTNAAVERRTGRGIVGVAANTFGAGGSAFLTARGSVGLAGGQPFLADPVPPGGGLVVAEVGAPGVDVARNGTPAARSGRSGRAVLPVEVAGVPTRVGVEPDRLPADALADVTERSVVVRQGGAAVAAFGVRQALSSAVVTVEIDGRPPPPGSLLRGADSEALVGPTGRAFLERIRPGESLRLVAPDGSSCAVETGFDGRGGAARRIGPLPCR